MKNSIYLSKEYIDSVLAVPSTPGKKNLEPLKTFAKENGLPFSILEDKEVINEAEVHNHESDLWYCLSGEVEFIYGGELVDPRVKTRADGTTDEREWKGSGVRGGITTVLKLGDWLWIPAGQPHQHNATGIARLVIIKVPVVKN